jgi:putative phosphoribosyl transferase
MNMATRFQDRSEAGKLLAKHLTKYADRTDVLVLGLPRGGVPVGFEVAKVLNAPLDVFIVRKLGVPGHEELAMGAIATGGVRVLNYAVVRAIGIPDNVIEAVSAREQLELKRRELVYRGDAPPFEVGGQTIILVDDGIATGSTMLAAVAALKQRRPARIVVAAPAAPASSCDELEQEVNEVVVVMKPDPFYAVGQVYEVFGQTSDAEVRDLLSRSKRVACFDEHAASRRNQAPNSAD